jgi:acylphosphatase
MKHLSIHVSGKVQGVFFRASAKEEAERLGIKGFAQNKPDGRVYIEAEGDEEKLNQYVAWCHRGPTHAIVETVTVREELVCGYKSFEVKR